MRLIIADDHALFRQGLRSLLSLQPHLEVVAEVARADELEDSLAATPCDILLLDLQMDEWAIDRIPAFVKTHCGRRAHRQRESRKTAPGRCVWALARSSRNGLRSKL